MSGNEELQDKLNLIFRLLTSGSRSWTPEEAGAILGKSRSTIYRAISEGRLQTIDRAGRVRIPRAELARFNDGQDPLEEIVPFLREMMNHLRCPLLNHPTCPMRDTLNQFD